MTGELTVKEYNLEYEPECQAEEQVIESITKEEIVEDDAGDKKSEGEDEEPIPKNGIENIIDDVEITNEAGEPQDSYRPYEGININVYWSVKSDINKGHTFSLKLPEELRGFDGTIALKDSEGNNFGQGLGSGDTITFTFLDNVKQYEAMSGSFYIQSEIIYVAEGQGPIEVPLEFNVEDRVIRQIVTVDMGYDNGEASKDLKQHKGQLKIIKIDEITQEPLEGALFKLVDNEGQIVAKLETDVNGEAMTDEIPTGIYTLMEIKAPEGYEKEQGPKELILNFKDNSMIEMVVTNRRLDSLNKQYSNSTMRPGELNIDKVGEQVSGVGNQWDITLEIEGQNYNETSDIVLVIDRSNSMRGHRMERAKGAAKAFVNRLLSNEECDNVRIAIVSFAGDVTVNSEFKGYDDKQALLDAIDSIETWGGTHIQAGLRQASILLNDSSASRKNIVILGDGAATYSYLIRDPDNYLEYWYVEPFRVHYRTTFNIPQKQFNYKYNFGDGTSEYTLYNMFYGYWGKYYCYYRHGASAIAEANFAREKGQVIYSIALSAGEEGEWTLRNIADRGNYYELSDPDSLEPIFLEIAGRIDYVATDVVVTDPIGDMYSIPGINTEDIDSLIEVSHGKVYYDMETDTITWDIGTISEGITYWMKYRVMLDYSAEGGVLYPANGPTYINYRDTNGDDVRKHFPIPEFRLRALTFTKYVEGLGKEDREFDIIIEGPVGKFSKTWSISLKEGETKCIKGLLPGIYTIREIVPMNFDLIDMRGVGITYKSGNMYELSIAEDDWNISIDIVNKRRNEGWFWSDPLPKLNRFRIGHKKLARPNYD